jgi:putative PIN family toxin of toxin-antitoxin system
MLVVLDTNILVSSLLVWVGPAADIYRAWRSGRFTILTSEEQLVELRATLRKPRLAGRVKPFTVGRLVNDIREFAEMADRLPTVRRSPDPTDDFLLAICEAGKADYLVSGDKGGLLALETHRTTRIVTARTFVSLLRD